MACAVNASLYEDPNFENFTQGVTSAIQGCECSQTFKTGSFEGQRVAPPPFNDRCVAVSGRCGGACQSWDTEDLKRHREVGTNGFADPTVFDASCTDDGYIEQSALVQHIPPLLCCILQVQ